VSTISKIHPSSFKITAWSNLVVRNHNFRDIVPLGYDDQYMLVEETGASIPYTPIMETYKFRAGTTLLNTSGTLYNFGTQHGIKMCRDKKYIYVITNRVSIPNLTYIWTFTLTGKLVRKSGLLSTIVAPSGIETDGKNFYVLDTISGTRYLKTLDKNYNTMKSVTLSANSYFSLAFNGKHFWTNYSGFLSAGYLEEMNREGKALRRRPFNVLFSGACWDGKHPVFCK